MKKKAYMNPTMRVVVLKQSRMLCSSGRSRSVRGVSSANEDFIFVDGIDGEDM